VSNCPSCGQPWFTHGTTCEPQPIPKDDSFSKLGRELAEATLSPLTEKIKALEAENAALKEEVEKAQGSIRYKDNDIGRLNHNIKLMERERERYILKLKEARAQSGGGWRLLEVGEGPRLGDEYFHSDTLAWKSICDLEGPRVQPESMPIRRRMSPSVQESLTVQAIVNALFSKDAKEEPQTTDNAIPSREPATPPPSSAADKENKGEGAL